MFRILTQCGAQVRKSLEGLDYFVAEGGRAFVTLQEIIDKLVTNQMISQDCHKDYHALLLQAKQYLRTDFKVQVHAVLFLFILLSQLSHSGDLLRLVFIRHHTSSVNNFTLLTSS